jgi:hypothetical protein
MGVQVSRPRGFFPPEYKAEVVELIRSTGKTVGQVARELDLTETSDATGSVLSPSLSMALPYHRMTLTRPAGTSAPLWPAWQRGDDRTC